MCYFIFVSLFFGALVSRGTCTTLCICFLVGVMGVYSKVHGFGALRAC